MVSSFSVSSMHSSEEEIWKVQLSCLSSLEQKIDEKVQLFSLLYFFFRDTTVQIASFPVNVTLLYQYDRDYS